MSRLIDAMLRFSQNISTYQDKESVAVQDFVNVMTIDGTNADVKHINAIRGTLMRRTCHGSQREHVVGIDRNRSYDWMPGEVDITPIGSISTETVEQDDAAPEILLLGYGEVEEAPVAKDSRQERRYLHGQKRYIPDSIGWGFSQLITLDLSSFWLYGPIPESIYKLEHLRHLRLNNNRLTGEIPPLLFYYLKYLVLLDLSDNQLTGGLPISFMKDLHARENQQTVLSIINKDKENNNNTNNKSHHNDHTNNNSVFHYSPSQYYTSKKGLSSHTHHHRKSHPCQMVYLQHNKLSGDLTDALNACPLPYLLRLNLSNNQFSGTVDANEVTTANSLCSLQALDVTDNKQLKVIPVRQYPNSSTRNSHNNTSHHSDIAANYHQYNDSTSSTSTSDSVFSTATAPVTPASESMDTSDDDDEEEEEQVEEDEMEYENEDEEHVPSPPRTSYEATLATGISMNYYELNQPPVSASNTVYVTSGNRHQTSHNNTDEQLNSPNSTTSTTLRWLFY